MVSMDLRARRQAACNLMQRLSYPIVILSEHRARFSNIGEVPGVTLVSVNLRVSLRDDEPFSPPRNIRTRARRGELQQEGE